MAALLIRRPVARPLPPSSRAPAQRRGSALALAAIGMLLAIAFGAPAPSAAQGECLYPYFWGQLPGDSPQPNNCFGSSGFRCYQGIGGQPYFRLKNPSCNPQVKNCAVQLRVPLEFPGVKQMVDEDGLGGAPTPFIYWFDQPTAPPCPGTSHCGQETTCGVAGFGGKINRDFIETWVERAGVNCGNAGQQTGNYSIRAISCLTGCRKDMVVNNLSFASPSLPIFIGCPPPPRPWSCPEPAPNSCPLCRPGGTSPAGGPPGLGPASGGGTGPGAFGRGAALRYAAGGAGGTDFPGTPEWNQTLGRYWSHDYAQRIVVDPDESHVWLITEYAIFREFSGLASGVYGTVSPSDEQRELRRVGLGWELHELDGTVHTFNAGGRWVETVDRNGNAKVATYSADQLTAVAMPDGRREDFTYYPLGHASEGKLESITEVGVGSGASRGWTYTWSGDDLVRIDAPDGTALELFYEDGRFPGYVTRMEKVGGAGGRRIERAWSYDGDGNVIDTWAGDVSATGPGAVDRWRFAFDQPKLPSVTTVTDPLGDVSTVRVGRDLGSLKPKLLEVTGDCPGCGLSPDTQLVYGDAAHPLRPTRRIDGNGNETRFTYDGRGQLTSRTEAFATPLERTTDWQFDPDFPAFPTLISQPSTAGGGAMRETMLVYDASGNLDQRTVSGIEGGAPFSYTTDFTPNTAGRTLTVDPPGYATADRTVYTYDVAGRNGLVADSRTDPLVGTTTFAHDAFNRRVGVTDPNGVLAESRYDALDRITHSIERSDDAAVPGDPIVAVDLVTEHVYDEFGELLRTILPEGNVVEYGYDDAGRLISIERKPDAATPGERTFFTLDAAGNRILEEQQRWDGAGWVTEASTAFVFISRCQLHKQVQAPGLPEEAVTEYAYDCDGNLERVWDPNHPSAGQTAPATAVYGYDALDRLVSVTRPWAGAGGGTAVTSYGYDVQDHLTSVTDAGGNRTAYVYSDRDLLTAEASEFLATGPACGTFPDCAQTGCGCSTSAYNPHGELETSTDPRGVTVIRTVDEIDRVTLADYPDPALDTVYTYDDPAVPFSLGRLTAIVRDGESIDYRYDRFGRLLRDGGLTYSYDENGNRLTIGYPSGVTATYGHDFADRPQSLTADWGGGPVSLVETATYLPAGPLATLTLGNGLVESRAFDGRYLPERITVAGLLDWDYTTDAVGNVSAVTDLLDPAGSRSYGYQDVDYFLTATAGPWGDESWSYDKIGNRLSAVEPGEPGAAVYSYPLNPTGGATPLLTGIVPTPGGSVAFGYDEAGHQVSQTAASAEGGTRSLFYAYDDAGRLAGLSSDFSSRQTTLSYDGRGLLREASLAEGLDFERTRPTYSSEGLLYSLGYEEQRDRGGPGDDGLSHTISVDRTIDLFAFGGRPVAQLARTAGGTDTLLYLTADHLGTPVLATDPAGTATWQGGFRPFGQPWTFDPQEQIFLRLPGQWTDPTFSGHSFRGELVQNGWRWYEAGTGRYTGVDPLPHATGIDVYSYARQNPLLLIDPLGLKVTFVDDRLQPFLDCARQSSPRASLGYNYLDGDDNPWEFRVLEEGQRRFFGGNADFMFDAAQRGICTTDCSTVEPPGGFWFWRRPGRFWISPAGGSCEEVMEALIHEIDERVRSIVSDRPHQAVHYEIVVPARQDAARACRECCPRPTWPD